MSKDRKSLTPRGDTAIRIVSGIQEAALSGPSVSEDLSMVRSALLYADRVEMYSLGTTLFLQSRGLTGLGDDEYIRWFLATISSTQSLAKPHLTTSGLSLSVFDWAKAERDKFTRAQWRSRPKAERAKVDDILTVALRAARESKSSFKRMWVDHGGPEIETAIESGLLTVNREWSDLLAIALDEERIDASVNLINEALRPECGNVMVDNMVGGLARAMLRENKLKVPNYRMDDVRETALGAKMILNLPNMAAVSVEKVLEVREDIAPSLGSYRNSVAKLNELLREDPFSPDLPGEIDHVWYKEVAPRVDELERAVFDSSLGRYKDAVVAGGRAGANAMFWGSLSIGVANYANIDWANLGVAAPAIGASLASGGVAVASGKSGIDAFKEELVKSRTQRKRAQNDGLFYLANINRSTR